jgi:glycosyltransferase involved in cell wall biosynthesis
MVKFGWLHQVFPHSPFRYNILYLGSSTLPPDWPQLLSVARRKRAKVVWNQNGVGYPAWAGAEWESVNQPMKVGLQTADYVLYQSQFCKQAADKFLGTRSGACEVLYNPVDTELFEPATGPISAGRVVLLHAGSIDSWYRVETAIRTIAELAYRKCDAQLVVAGRLGWSADPALMTARIMNFAQDIGVGERISYLPPYSRAEGPALFRRAHILLHTTVNDACPTVVLEGMASGLPVVYSASGGVPELVGEEAGIGVPDRAGWEEMAPADPAALADAVVNVLASRDAYARAARARAVERFNLRAWLERHREVFETLLK